MVVMQKIFSYSILLTLLQSTQSISPTWSQYINGRNTRSYIRLQHLAVTITVNTTYITNLVTMHEVIGWSQTHNILLTLLQLTQYTTSTRLQYTKLHTVTEYGNRVIVAILFVSNVIS